MTPLAMTETWLRRLAQERQASPHTLAGYRRDLNKLLQYMEAQQLAHFEQLHAEHMRHFIASQHRNGLSPRSLQRLLSACRSLFRQLHRENLLHHDPLAGVRGPKPHRKLPLVLDPDETAALVEFDSGDALALRDRAMLELFYSSGLRLSELIQLIWQDLDLHAGMVRVLGKGNKTRIVPVGSHAVHALKRWAMANNAQPNQPVFPGRNGTRLSPRAVQLRFKTLALRQGSAKHLHPHLLRHTFASHMLESSGNLRAVQELLGHADLATTQIYTHLDFQHLARVYDTSHPRAKRK